MRPLVALLLMACSPSPDPAPSQASSEVVARRAPVDVHTLAALPKQQRVLIDVRTPSEFASGYVPGAVNIPIDQLPDRLHELSAHQGADIYAICHSGGRSSHAVALLAEVGIDAHNITGGTQAYIAAGYSVQ